MHTNIFTLLFGALQLLIGVVLIVAVTMSDSKNEGLTGQIGSTVTSSFKGKAGREEHMNSLTRGLAVGFFVISICVAFVTK